MTNKAHMNESGATLLEILLVVGIGFVALLGIFSLGTQVQSSNQAESAERLLTSLVTEVQAVKKVTNSYSSLTDCNLSASTAADCTLVQNNILQVDQKNPFGGGIAITPTSDNQVTISFKDVNSKACSKLLTETTNQPKLSKVDVYASNQDIITIISDNAMMAIKTCSTTPLVGTRGRQTGSLNFSFISNAYAAGGGSSMQNCQIPTGESGGGSPISYSVATIDSFPAAIDQVNAICAIANKQTLVWTFN